jgi:concanavalin A-like lectin/glucanase superfamily protein
MNGKRHPFTVIELLVSVSILGILASLLMPNLVESRQRARFVRWAQFNKQCSTDPSCVVNFNFQEGEGDILTNSAYGYEAEGFNADDYKGYIRGDYQWAQGRWTKYKKALQLDGASTFFEFLSSKHVDFTSTKGFTFIISLKFDILNKFDGIFGKCYMRNAVNGIPQYVMYYDNTKSGDLNSTKLFHMDIGDVSATFANTDENGAAIKAFNDMDWVHFVLRNKIVGDTRELDLFINGVKLKGTYSNLSTGNQVTEDANLAIGCIRWLVLNNRDKNDPAPFGKPDNFLKGKIDELLIYNRALKDAEVNAHYLMAAEHL